METNWKKINEEKRNDIAWMNAKNNAVSLVTRHYNLDSDNCKVLIEEWANWLYKLEPKEVKKTPEKKATEKQINFIVKLKYEKGEKYPPKEWLNSLSPFAAKQEIDRLLKLTTVDFGDRPFDENIEDEIQPHNSISGFDPEATEEK